ncbi:MAG: glycosyltransferase [Nitriliruptorales bacterium]|nr:glycosyltransferase [Nitriliruptorales bacterium]
MTAGKPDASVSSGLVQPREPAGRVPAPTRLAVLSLHTSPLEQPGTGDGGGLNVYVREVVSRLDARGVEVDIWTRRTDAGQPDVVPLGPRSRVRHVRAGATRSLAKEALTAHLADFADGVLAASPEPPDVVHGHYWLSGWVGARLSEAWNVPFVQTFHTLGVVKNASLAPGDRPEPGVRLAAESSVAWSADRVLGLTCSEAGLLHDTYGLSGTRLAVVPPGVDMSRFHASADPVDQEARGLLPTGDGPLLLFVGRLQPLKGPDVAIRTLAAVWATVPGARLLVVGGPSGSGEALTGPEQLHALAVELGVADSVRIVPAQPQELLAGLYRAADVVVVPSRSESFGLVALEAQACGTPVVGARVPGLEFVIRDGGILVDGWDPADHANAVISFLTDPELAARTSAAGIAMGQSASWDRTVDRLVRVYGDVVAARLQAA